MLYRVGDTCGGLCLTGNSFFYTPFSKGNRKEHRTLDNNGGSENAMDRIDKTIIL